MFDKKVKLQMIEREIEGIEGSIWITQARVECAELTKDEQLKKANQEIMVKLLQQKDFFKRRLGEIEKESDDEKATDGIAPSQPDARD